MYNVNANNINRLLLFLCKGKNDCYSFRLSNGDFNNLLVECRDGEIGTVYCLSQGDTARNCINEKTLLESRNQEFHVARYYAMYLEKRRSFVESNATLNDFVVSTTADIDNDARGMFNAVERTDLLEPSERFKFKDDVKLMIAKKLKVESTFYQLAKHIACGKRFELQNELCSRNLGFLVKKVLDVTNDSFQDNFFDSEELASFRNLVLELLEIPSDLTVNVETGDVEGVGERVQKLAKFINVKNGKYTSTYFAALFDKYVDSMDRPKGKLCIKKEMKRTLRERITKKKELAHLLAEQMEAFRNGDEAVLQIDDNKKREEERGKRCTLKLADLNELAGYVLVRKENASPNVYKFNPSFFAEGLPGDVERFRKVLFDELRVDSAEDLVKHDYSFTVNKYVNWTEAQFNSFLRPYVPDDEVTDAVVDEFLNTLTFATNGSSEIEKTKSFLEDLMNVSIDDSKLKIVQDMMQAWLTRTEYFTSKNVFLKDVKQVLIGVKLDLSELTLKYTKRHQEFPIEFERELNEVVAFLKDDDKRVLNVVNDYDVALSRAKLIQVLINREKLFLDLNRLTNQHFVPELVECDLLVVETEGEDGSDVEKVYKHLKRYLESRHNKLAIVSTRSERKLSNKFMDCVQMDDVENNFEHLTRGTRERVLSETDVSFCGKSVRLKELVSKDFNAIIVPELLAKIIKNETIVVGSKRSASINEIYVEQTMTRLVEIDARIKENELFQFRKDDVLKPETGQDIVLVSGDNEQFESLCKLYPANREVHHLKETNGVLVWLRSRVTPKNLQPYRIKSTRNVVDNSLSVNEIDERFVVIAAETGTGKTTLLKRLAETTRKEWTVIVDLVKLDRNDALHVEKWKNLEQIKALMYEGTDLDAEDRFQRELFSHLFDKKEVVLLFDGFDEIPRRSKDGFIQILGLVKIYTKRCWVTCRPDGSMYALEGHLDTFSYTLQPVETRSYLDEYFRRSFGGVCPGALEAIASEIDERLGEDRRRTFGKSLLVSMAVKVLAEIFTGYVEGTFETISDEDKRVIEDALNLNTLFERFLGLKIGPETVDGTKWTDLMHVSLRDLFLRGNSLQPLIEKVGLTTTDGFIKNWAAEETDVVAVEGGRVVFGHPSFPRFFAALWLSRHWKTPVVGYFIKNNLLDGENEVLRDFFDRTLGADEFVLNGNCDAVKAYRDVLVRDNGGRSLLHLAACRGRKDMIEVLLSKIEADQRKDYVNAMDEVLCWTALSYALKCGHWEICELLLEQGGNESDVDDYNNGCDTVDANGLISLNTDEKLTERKHELLMTAVRSGYTRLLKSIVKKCGKHKVIHEALRESVRRGHVDIVGLLLKTSAKPETKGERDKNCLHLAVDSRKLEVLRCIFEKSRDVKGFLEDVDDEGNTALLYATTKKESDMMKFLCTIGAKLDVENKKGVSVASCVSAETFKELELLASKSQSGDNKVRKKKSVWSGCFGQ